VFLEKNEKMFHEKGFHHAARAILGIMSSVARATTSDLFMQ
jgi:hypothetical protein